MVQLASKGVVPFLLRRPRRRFMVVSSDDDDFIGDDDDGFNGSFGAEQCCSGGADARNVDENGSMFRLELLPFLVLQASLNLPNFKRFLFLRLDEISLPFVCTKVPQSAVDVVVPFDDVDG